MRIAAVLFVASACSCPEPMVDAPPSPWSLGPALPGPRLEPGVAALGQRVVVAGGFYQNQQQGLGITRDVVAFDQFEGTWTAYAEAPVEWTHANLAGATGTLYLLGGAEGTDFIARGDAYALDIDVPSATWRPLAPMPPGLERSASGVVVGPSSIYLIGGASTTGAVASVLAYNISMDTWSELPPLPAPRSHPAVMRTADGTLIAAGGLATLESSSARGEVWALPLGATEWEPRAPMLTARGGCAYGTVFTQLICAGGEAGSSALRSVERYDELIDQWTALDDMPAARAGTQAAVIGDRLYVPGGAEQLRFEPTDTLFVFSYLDAIAD